MKLFDDIKQIDKLVADGKLNPIYLERDLQDLIYVIPTKTLTQILFRYSIDKLELTEEQLKALISDIDILKSHNIWDVDEEKKTLSQCKRSVEDAEVYKLLSQSDKTKYNEALITQFEI